MTAIARAHAYLAKLPFAIAGQRGHAATFAAACRLVEFGLPEADAWQELCEWNQTHCEPPWSEPELRHKLADAFRCTSPKSHFAASLTIQPFPRWDNPTARGPKRPAMPPLRPGTAAEISRLADLRSLSREGVSFANEKGLLRFGEFRGRAAWFIVDASGRVAQARRLDGAPWADDVKARTLPGSQAAWPIGIGEAANSPSVALVEGGPDLLAVCAFLVAERREGDCAPVAMLGGCSRIHSEALPLFADKRVRIFPHVDDTGDSAANRWAEQLAEARADVDAFSLAGLRRTDGAPVKDLCDLAAIHADDFETHRCLWNLFR